MSNDDADNTKAETVAKGAGSNASSKGQPGITGKPDISGQSDKTHKASIGSAPSDASAAAVTEAASATETSDRQKADCFIDDLLSELQGNTGDLLSDVHDGAGSANPQALSFAEEADHARAARALYDFDDQTPIERIKATAAVVRAHDPVQLTGADPRFIRDAEAERLAAHAAMVMGMGAAADTAAVMKNEVYSQLPRLQQLCLLGLAGTDSVMRRAAASDVVRLLPDMAEDCATWMETLRASEAERLGLELAAKIDWRAFQSGNPQLSLHATGILLASLQTPLLRSLPMATIQNNAVYALAKSTGPVLQEGTPHSIEALQRLRIIDAGIMPLPLGDGRISLIEPARRVAAALRDSLQGNRGGRFNRWTDLASLKVQARLEQIVIGIGMLLSGATRDMASTETGLIPVACSLAQTIVRGTVDVGGLTFQESMEKARVRNAEQVKSAQEEADLANKNFLEALESLEKLGLDIAGNPRSKGGDGTDGDGAATTGDSTEHDAPRSIIVCPKFAKGVTGKIKEAIQGHEHMLGLPIALVPTGDLPARRKQLIREFPYAVDLVDFILGDLTSKPMVHIRPVLLTGTPGNGKTHFARRFAHVFGLHLWAVDCSGSDGAVFAGTDRRWYSAEPCHPFLAMSRGKQANPLVLLDELEKAPTRQDYGRLWDSLLPFLDPGSNRAIQDKCLQVPVDASHINFIATANRIDALPWPLRDRLRIIAFPEPTPEFLPALIPPLLADLATSRALDQRFIEPLTEEDHAFIAQRWKGGSVRRLARLLEAIINARERAMPKH
jgi:ATPase family associated with various cellular activities (AAA)